MKSLWVKLGVIFLFTGLTILGYAEVWGQDWRLYGEDLFASYYYDAEKILRPSKNIVKVWGKAVYKKDGVTKLVARLGEGFKTTSFSIDLSELDFFRGKYKELQRTFFSERATYLGEGTDLSEGNIIRGSIQIKLYKIVCE